MMGHRKYFFFILSFSNCFAPFGNSFQACLFHPTPFKPLRRDRLPLPLTTMCKLCNLKILSCPGHLALRPRARTLLCRLVPRVSEGLEIKAFPFHFFLDFIFIVYSFDYHDAVL